MFGAKKISEKDLEILKLKEQITARDLSSAKFETKDMGSAKNKPMETNSDYSEFAKKLSSLVNDFIFSERKKAEEMLEREKQESIIKAKQEQFNNDVKGFEENKTELMKKIKAEIDISIKSANNHHDGAIALMYLGDLKRKIEEI